MPLNNFFGISSPHARIRALTEKEKAATREQVEATRTELNVTLETANVNVQKAIRTVRHIDNTPPVDKRARRNAMRMLRMYIGQHRVIQAMSDNLELVYSELTIREMTTEFSKSMSTLSGLIQQYSRQSIGPGKLARQMKGVLKPTQSADSLREYDRMYEELTSIYGAEDDNDPSNISDSWLEQVVAGTVDWSTSSLSDAVAAPAASAEAQPAPAQPASAPAQGATSQDILRMLSSLDDRLKD